MSKTNKSNKPKVINKDEVSSKMLVHEKKIQCLKKDNLKHSSKRQQQSPTQLSGDETDAMLDADDLNCVYDGLDTCGGRDGHNGCDSCLSQHCIDCTDCTDYTEHEKCPCPQAETPQEALDMTHHPDNLTDLITCDLAPDVFMWIYTISKLVYE